MSTKIQYKSLDSLGFLGYKISNTGIVFSAWKKRSLGNYGFEWYVSNRWKKLTPWLVDGHPQVGLKTVQGKIKKIYVHKLVLMTFIGPCPKNYECRHLDGNPQNNNISNLKWGTRTENSIDKLYHGQHNNCNITPEQAKQIKKLIATKKFKLREIAKQIGTTIYTVKDISRRRSWKHV